MANQRLSTIYDYATLRLHRDGTRVQQSDENYHVPKRKQFAIKDASGNWIAKDAGGLGMANKTRYVRREEDDGQEEYVSLGGGGKECEVEKTDEWVLLERERTQNKKDHRTEKRRRFEENLDFLDISHNASSTSTPTREPSLPVPSSELLKSIHYFAASFYTNRDQLLDLGKTYREEKKARERLRYAAKKGKRKHVRPSGEDEESHTEQESSEASTSITKTSYLQAKTKRDVRKKHQQDMYKVMDGTALMALGMLVQEHVARLVQGKVPDGWEEEMRGADELGEGEVDGSELDESSGEEIPSEIAEDEPNGAADPSESSNDEIEPEVETNSDDEE